MGKRGPAPNRSDDLAPSSVRGRNAKHVADDVTRGELRPVRWPNTPSDWHPIAKMVWKSLKESGQADFYQQSDIAFAYSVCEDLSHYKQGSKGIDRETGELYNKARSGQMLTAIMGALSNLLMTEADRRRVRIELQAPEPESTPASVLAIADYKRELEVEDS